MRLFIRVETSFVVTIDIPDTSTVLDLKHALWDSKQTQISLSEMNLYKMDSLVPNNAIIGEEMMVKGVKFPYLVLLKERPGRSIVLFDQGLNPKRNDVGIQLSVELKVPLCVSEVTVKEGTIDLRTRQDQKCSGELTVVEEDGVKVILFKPHAPLIANYEYMVYIDGGKIENRQPEPLDTQFKHEVWSFKTIPLLPIRVIVSENTIKKPKLVTLERNGHDLFLELQSKTASRFGLPPHQCRHFTLQANQITNNYDISMLKDNDAIEFRNDPNAPFTDVHVHDDSPALTFEEYKKQHWVNEEAGFYALVGKMTKEEEDAALLDVYNAFVTIENERK